jgi:UPF0755 protein
LWYQSQLKPVGNDLKQQQRFVIADKSTSGQIGKQLEDAKIIHSALAFGIYLRLSNNGNNLQAGTYRLSPAETMPQIVKHLVSGSVDKFTITFYPGETLSDATKILKKAGYSESEITSALSANYNSLLFQDKPSTADLEGYIYGETYSFNAGATVEDILTAVFNEYYTVVHKYGLIEKFKAHGLNLYQGITLASIVQREASKANDQKQVAQVFYSRLAAGTMLGSDVTYQYIADKTGVARDPNLDSPYNTRRYTGLTPGPISNPGLTALQAVADPAEGDYMFFLNGDDDIMYYAHTNAEHEANITAHCKVKCSTL